VGPNSFFTGETFPNEDMYARLKEWRGKGYALGAGVAPNSMFDEVLWALTPSPFPVFYSFLSLFLSLYKYALCKFLSLSLSLSLPVHFLLVFVPIELFIFQFFFYLYCFLINTKTGQTR
jgi:hypothetical protein